MEQEMLPPPAIVEIEPESSGDGSSQNSVMLVALYLVLLAFFIMLNSLAFNDSQRSDKALSSVQSAFKSSQSEIKLLSRAPKTQSMDIVIKRHYQHLENLTRNYIDLEELETTQRGNILEVSFPASAVFLPNRSLIRDDKRAFLKHVAASVFPGVAGALVEVSIIGQSRSYLSDSLAAEKQLEILRIGALARFIAINRVPKHQIYTGMSQGKQNMITLRFEVVSSASRDKR